MSFVPLIFVMVLIIKKMNVYFRRSLYLYQKMGCLVSPHRWFWATRANSLREIFWFIHFMISTTTWCVSVNFNISLERFFIPYMRSCKYGLLGYGFPSIFLLCVISFRGFINLILLVFFLILVKIMGVYWNYEA